VKALKQFGLFWYDFIVGDDWRIAVGVVVAMAITFFATHHDFNPWWFLPLAVAAFLGLSVRRARTVK